MIKILKISFNYNNFYIIDYNKYKSLFNYKQSLIYHISSLFYINKSVTDSNLINSESKVNVIQFKQTKKLGLYVRQINIGTQKVDGTSLKKFIIIITFFEFVDKKQKSQFFKIFFYLLNWSLMLFSKYYYLTWAIWKTNFLELEFFWNTYFSTKSILITKQFKLIGQKKFVSAVQNLKK